MFEEYIIKIAKLIWLAKGGAGKSERRKKILKMLSLQIPELHIRKVAKTWPKKRKIPIAVLRVCLSDFRQLKKEKKHFLKHLKNLHSKPSTSIRIRIMFTFGIAFLDNLLLIQAEGESIESKFVRFSNGGIMTRESRSSPQTKLELVIPFTTILHTFLRLELSIFES